MEWLRSLSLTGRLALYGAIILVVVALLARDSFGGVLLILVGFIAYFLPSIIAYQRKVPNAGSVFVVDAFLGWTVIGWIVSLAMAARDVKEA